MSDDTPQNLVGLLRDCQDDIDRAVEAAENGDMEEVTQRSLCGLDHLSTVADAAYVLEGDNE